MTAKIVKDQHKLRMLYQTWLDISYADEYFDDIIHDFTLSLKEMKKQSRITKKNLKLVTDAYTKLNGNPPLRHK